MTMSFTRIWSGLGIALAMLAATTAAALAGTGQPTNWQYGLQGPVTEVADSIRIFHDVVTVVITIITIFVFILLAIVILRFNERANPTPSRVTHNTTLEVLWTVVPILILIGIAIPSFKLLYLQYAYPKPDLTIKATGKSWYWEHEYPDHGAFTVASTMVRDEDVLKTELGADEFNKRYGKLEGLARSRRLYIDAQPLWAKQKRVRQLSVDNEIAVPVNKVVHVLVTSSDVIHNWTVPSFGSKLDAVPGRVTATWFKATKPGIYYGQCSELCGRDHSNMPIAVRVVSQQAFDAWATALKDAKAERNPTQRRELLKRAKDVLQQAALDDERASKLKVAAGTSR